MPLNYTKEAITAAQNGISRLKEALDGYDGEIKQIENELTKEFSQCMADDFNTSQALAILFKIVDKINTEKDKKAKTELQATLHLLSDTLGLTLKSSAGSSSQDSKSLSSLVELLLAWRISCKSEKDYKNADYIRDTLIKSNIEVRDLPNNKHKWTIKV